jgi:hypothetical protein
MRNSPHNAEFTRDATSGNEDEGKGQGEDGGDEHCPVTGTVDEPEEAGYANAGEQADDRDGNGEEADTAGEAGFYHGDHDQNPRDGACGERHHASPPLPDRDYDAEESRA